MSEKIDPLSESQAIHGLSHAELLLWGAMFGWTATVERLMAQSKRHPPPWRKVPRLMTGDELANVPVGYCCPMAWAAATHKRAVKAA